MKAHSTWAWVSFGALCSSCVLNVKEVSPVAPVQARGEVPATAAGARDGAAADELAPIELLPDDAVARAVRIELGSTGIGAERLPIEVNVERGVVALNGVVPSGLYARRAVERAQTVRGVRAVVNRLQLAAANLSDSEIETRVRQRWAANPAVQEAEITPTSKEGVVRLAGAARSFTEKQIAAELAWSVRGVRDVVNEIRVAPAEPRDDREIRADVVARIERDAFLSDDPIQVFVQDGVVSLRGAVGSLMEGRRALTAAWVTGVRWVEGEQLIVDPARRDGEQRRAMPVLADNQVAEAVRDTLRLDPRVPEGAIAVRAAGGIVTLSGAVPSVRSKRAAERDAANTVGVWRVDSLVAVAPPAPFTDTALATQIREQLTENSNIDVKNVIVEVEDGRVRIRGEAAGRLESLAIEEVVERIPGVLEVANELRVMEPLAAVRDDEMIERDIETALYWDPRVDSADVDIDVVNGVAVIRGKAPNRAVREAILENVWEARPRGIEDRLVRPGP